jgi:hypothetical protein
MGVQLALGKPPFDLFAQRRFQGILRLVSFVVTMERELIKQPIPPAKQMVHGAITQHGSQIDQVNRFPEGSFRDLRLDASAPTEIIVVPIKPVSMSEASLHFTRYKRKGVAVWPPRRGRRGVDDRF